MNRWEIQSFEDITEEKILAALEQVRPDIEPSPVRKMGEVWGKFENTNPTGAFKVRGGLIYFEWLKIAHPDVTTAIAATRGNHGQSVAYAAGKAGLKCRIVVPDCNCPAKNEAMRRLGAEVVIHGKDFAESLAFAEKEAAETGAHFVPSFDWKLVLGVSTYGHELLTAVPDLDAVFVPIGLGSGICGTIAARNALGLAGQIKIIGVVAEKAPAYYHSWEAGHVVEGREIPDTIADGVACRIPNESSFEVIRRTVEEIVMIPEAEIKTAMGELSEMTGLPVEGAGALGYAAWKRFRGKFKNPAVIVSGGNTREALSKTITH